LIDVDSLSQSRPSTSTIVSSVLDNIPSDISLQDFAYTTTRMSMSFTANSFEVINNYEKYLRNNPNYSDVSVSLSKTGDYTSVIEFTISFNFVKS